jgi:hypothetical protein
LSVLSERGRKEGKDMKGKKGGRGEGRNPRRKGMLLAYLTPNEHT